MSERPDASCKAPLPAAHVEDLHQRLLALDDPDHFERPGDYDHESLRLAVQQLKHILDVAFGSNCSLDLHVQDASHHTRLGVPAEATGHGEPLVIVVSNFGRLAVWGPRFTDAVPEAQVSELVTTADAARVQAALDEGGFLTVPRTLALSAYDGAYDFSAAYQLPELPTWYTRFFSYYGA